MCGQKGQNRRKHRFCDFREVRHHGLIVTVKIQDRPIEDFLLIFLVAGGSLSTFNPFLLFLQQNIFKYLYDNQMSI